MTDTTDIKALSSKIVYQLMDLGCAEEGVEERAVAFVSSMISKTVEAERQRVAIIEQTSQMRLERANANEAYYKEMEKYADKLEKAGLQLEAENEALKAKLANPVVLPSRQPDLAILTYTDAINAINAAGFMVKGGE